MIYKKSTSTNISQSMYFGKYTITKKRALHAPMSHSTVCNTTVSTNKIRLTLVKSVCTTLVKSVHKLAT